MYCRNLCKSKSNLTISYIAGSKNEEILAEFRGNILPELKQKKRKGGDQQDRPEKRKRLVKKDEKQKKQVISEEESSTEIHTPSGSTTGQSQARGGGEQEGSKRGSKMS